MVLRASETAWGALARPPETVQAGPGKPQTYPRWGSEVEHRGPTRKAVRSEVGSECAVRHLPGSKAEQGAREKASRPRTGPCCSYCERRGGRECGDWVSCTAILALLGPGEKGNCSFFEVLGTTGWRASGGTEQKGNKRFSTRPSSGGRSGAVTISWRAGSRDSGSPVSGTPLALALHGLGRGRDGLRRFPAASSTLRPLWRLLLRPSWSGGGGAGGRVRRRADGGAAAGGGVETAADRRGRICRNASVCCCAAENCWAKPSTASPNRPAWEIGASKNGVCQTPSYPPRSAIGGAPGPPTWTSSDPGPAPWLSSPAGRGPSLCAVPAIQLGQHHPRATALTPWPGGLAGGPWRAGRKRPVQQHCKPWPSERTRTYRPWTEGVDYPSRRQRPAGRAALQWRAQLGGSPHTLGPPHRRGWWGRRRH